jgi:hypothetical protein
LLGSVASRAVCTYRNDDANEAAPYERKTAMKIVPTSIEEQINRVDRQRSLFIGLGAASLAVWSIFRLIWSLYLGLAYGWFLGSFVFTFVLWGVIGAVALVAAVGFLTRYNRGS